MNDLDPIVEEVRRVRDAHAARFNYDLQAIYRDIQEQQKQSGLTFVSFSRKRTASPPTAEGGPAASPPAANASKTIAPPQAGGAQG